MLNPEYVDYDDKSKLYKIGFTDTEGDEVLEIKLPFREAWDLSHMIRDAVKHSRKK